MLRETAVAPTGGLALVGYHYSKLRDAAANGKPAARALECPSCRTQTFRVISIRCAEIDVCRKCVSIALDPGDMAALKNMGINKPGSVAESLDVIEVLTAILQIPG